MRVRLASGLARRVVAPHKIKRSRTGTAGGCYPPLRHPCGAVPWAPPGGRAPRLPPCVILSASEGSVSPVLFRNVRRREDGFFGFASE